MGIRKIIFRFAKYSRVLSYIDLFVQRFPVSMFLLQLKPLSIPIEASNYCNLHCITCPTAHSMKRARGNMTMNTFKTFLNQINWKVERLNWTFAGEPLMNPDIFDMINLAFEKGIKSKVDTNGMLLDRFIDQCINSNLYWINIAFEMPNKYGMQFRVGYDFNKVLKSIDQLCKKRADGKLKYPIISLNCLVHRYNEFQMNEAFKLGKEVGADILSFKSLNMDPSSTKSDQEFEEIAEKWLPSNPEFLRYTKKEGRWVVAQHTTTVCYPAMSDIVILWNGDVVMCCFDYNGDFVVGNIHDNSLSSIWKNQRYNKLRRAAIKRVLPICKRCTATAMFTKKVKLKKAT